MSDDRYPCMRHRRTDRSGLKLPPSRSAFGRTSAASAQARLSAKSSAVHSTAAARTLTWPTTTARHGAAGADFGRIFFAASLAGNRDELIISTKAGLALAG